MLEYIYIYIIAPENQENTIVHILQNSKVQIIAVVRMAKFFHYSSYGILNKFSKAVSWVK